MFKIVGSVCTCKFQREKFGQWETGILINEEILIDLKGNSLSGNDVYDCTGAQLSKGNLVILEEMQ